MAKPRLDTFAEKISRAQTKQLIEWLAEHTYSEACDLVATEPPAGFGLQVSIPTICRFHKTHYNAITQIRQETLAARAANQQLYSEAHEEFYRMNLDKGSTLCLQERLYEFLTRPVETIDDLKKLVYICKEVKNLEIPLDPDEAAKDKIVKLLRDNTLNRMIPSILTAAKPGGATAIEAPNTNSNASEE